MDFLLLLPAKGLQARNVLDRIQAERDIVLNTRVEFNIATPILRMVRDSKMLSLLSGSSVSTFPDLCAISLDEEGCEMTGCLHTLKGCYRTHSMEQFIRLLQEYISFHGMR